MDHKWSADHRGLKFNATVKWLTIIIGTVGAVGSAYMYFRKEVNSTDVAPVDVSTPDTNPSSAKDGVVNVSLGRNLPPVIDGLDKPPKLRATELQQERY